MSIVICVPAKNGVMFLSDGVAYDDDGTILGLCSKVSSVAAGSSVIAGIGAGSLMPVIESQISPSICTFDNLLENIIDFGRNAINYLESTNYRWDAKGTILVAGWSESEQAYRAYTFSTYAKGQLYEGEWVEKSPWELQPLDGIYVSTTPGEQYLKEVGIEDLFVDNSMPVDELAIRLVCAGRLSSRDFEPGEDEIPGSRATSFAVGGFIQSTFFEKDRFVQTIIHRWPDLIGEKVDPQSGDALPAFLTEQQPEPAA